MTNPVNQQGNQLRRDLNSTVAENPKNWAIPIFWAPVLKYISAPILAIIFSFAYPSFHAKRNDPLHIFAFSIMHLAMVLIAVGFIFPRWFDVFIPVERRGEADGLTVPGVTIGEELTAQDSTIDTGRGGFSKEMPHGSNYGNEDEYLVKTAY